MKSTSCIPLVIPSAFSFCALLIPFKAMTFFCFLLQIIRLCILLIAVTVYYFTFTYSFNLFICWLFFLIFTNHISSFSVAVIKMPCQGNLLKKEFILAYTSLEGSRVIRVHRSRDACQQVARELRAHIFQGVRKQPPNSTTNWETSI